MVTEGCPNLSEQLSVECSSQASPSRQGDFVSITILAKVKTIILDFIPREPLSAFMLLSLLAKHHRSLPCKHERLFPRQQLQRTTATLSLPPASLN